MRIRTEITIIFIKVLSRIKCSTETLCVGIQNAATQNALWQWWTANMFAPNADEESIAVGAVRNTTGIEVTTGLCVK